MEDSECEQPKKTSKYDRSEEDRREKYQRHGILLIEEPDKVRHRTVEISFSANLQP